MKKNLFFKISITFIVLTFICTSIVLADDIDDSDEDFNITNELNENNLKEVSANSVKDLHINSRSYIVLDRKTNKILLGKNENEKRKMASTTNATDT